ncbi:MAG: Subtilisin E [Candidatus Marinimicrobia bacterium]|nr:Subtilisin E [Candidatus Neomarinimicrobiota bacterium]
MNIVIQKLLLFLLISALVVAVEAQTEKPDPMSPQLHVHLENLPEDATEIVWVFFEDKGLTGKAEIQQRIAQMRENFPSRTLKRRSKVLPADQLVGYRDLPVHSPYISEVELQPGVRRIRTTTRWLNGISIEATPSAIREISSLPFVRRIRIVARGNRIEPVLPEEAPQPAQSLRREATTLDYDSSYAQLNQINAITAHRRGFTGQGVRVLVLDTGYMTDHEVFTQDRVIDEYDFINDDSVTQNESGDPSSQHNHGTQTASVVGGAIDGSLYGPAYECEYLLAKTEDLSQEQPIEEDWYVEGLEWGELNGADIMSSSLGYKNWYQYSDMDGNTAITTIAVDQAVSLGVVALTAAGNYSISDPNWTHIVAPGDADSVITVGAVDNSGAIASFSLSGPTYDGRTKPEVVARGVNTWMAKTYSTTSYGDGSGTSFSTPLVAGAAAQVVGAHPDWPPMLVKEALMMTADNADNPNNSYGWGIIDVMAAIDFSLISQMQLQFVEGASGNGNGRLDPGEAGALSGKITNSRLIPAQSVSISVETEFQGISMQDGNITWTNLNSGQSALGQTTIPAALDSVVSQSGAVPFTAFLEAQYQDYVYRDTLTIVASIGTPRVAIVDMAPDQSGESAIANDLAEHGIGVKIFNTFPVDGFTEYDGVFLSMGFGNDAYQPDNSEVQSITNYLDQAGNIYLEGGPIWYEQSAAEIQGYFHTVATDSSITGFGLTGEPGTPMDGMTFGIDSVVGSSGVFVSLSSGDDAESWLAFQENAAPAVVTATDSNYIAIASSVGYADIHAEFDGNNGRLELLEALVRQMNLWQRGDLTGDGSIDIRDVILFLAEDMANASVLPPRVAYAADVNQDGDVNQMDISTLTGIILTDD